MRRFGWMVVLGAAVLSASGCWGMSYGGPGQRSHNPLEAILTPDAVDELAPAWDADGMLDAVWGNVVLVSGPDPAAGGEVRLRGLAASSGAVLWSTDVAPVAGQVVEDIRAVVVDGRAWVAHRGTATQGGSSSCFSGAVRVDLSNGALVAGPAGRWAHPWEGAALAHPVVANCQPTPPPVVMDTATGATIFTPQLPGASGLRAQGGSLLVIGSGESLLGYPSGGCGASTCAPLWSLDLGGFPLQVAVSEDGRTVYASPTTLDFEVLVIDGATGQVIGHAPSDLSLANAFAVAGGNLYVTGGDTLRVYDDRCTGTCAPHWTAAIGDDIAQPVVGAGVVHVVGEQAVLSFDAAGCGASTCDPLGSFDTPGNQLHEAALAGGRLYLLTSTNGADFTVTAFAA